MFFFFKTIFKILIIIGILQAGLFLRPSYAKGSIDAIKEKSKTVKNDIKKQEKTVKEFGKKEIKEIENLQKIDLALNLVGKKLKKLDKKLESIAIRVKSAQNAIKNLKASVKAGEKKAFKSMVSLYKLQCLGSFNILASAGSVFDYLRRKRALKTILAHKIRVIENLEDRKKELEKLKQKLETRKKELESLKNQRKEQIRLLTEKKIKRKKLLKQIRENKSLALASLISLKKAAKELDRRIKAFYIESGAKNAGKGKYPGGSFKALKGLLKMPVKGKIVSLFGAHKNAEYNVMSFQSGINIKAEKGEPIHSVFAGNVIFADWFKGYGNMIIIDHGDHYYTLYAHAEELFKTKGNSVESMEVIGTVGDTGSMTGPGLHFEIRYHGKPVDPLKWLKTG